MGVMATADVCSGGYDPARAVPTVPAWPRADGSFSGRSFWEELREATAAESSTGGTGGPRGEAKFDGGGAGARRWAGRGRGGAGRDSLGRPAGEEKELS